jgi:DNA-binding NtrC family response regulator
MASVLLFEDEPLMLAILADVLEDAGLKAIVGAADRKGAAAQVAKADYDLVLTDMQMPNYSGVDVWEWVQRRWSGMPVVALTGASPPQLKQMGCDPRDYSAFFSKPADLELVLSTVDRLLSESTPH